MSNTTQSAAILTRRPKIWLIAALSFRVHSATTLARISFMYNINAFRGFLMWGFFLSAALLPSGLFFPSPTLFFWSTCVLQNKTQNQQRLQRTALLQKKATCAVETLWRKTESKFWHYSFNCILVHVGSRIITFSLS